MNPSKLFSIKLSNGDTLTTDATGVALAYNALASTSSGAYSFVTIFPVTFGSDGLLVPVSTSKDVLLAQIVAIEHTDSVYSYYVAAS